MSVLTPTLSTDHLEITLAPHADIVCMNVDPNPEQSHGLGVSVSYTADDARSLAEALRKVGSLAVAGEGSPITIESGELTTYIVEPNPDSPTLLVRAVIPKASVVLDFGLLAADAEELAMMLDQTAMLADKAGGAA